MLNNNVLLVYNALNVQIKTENSIQIHRINIVAFSLKNKFYFLPVQRLLL